MNSTPMWIAFLAALEKKSPNRRFGAVGTGLFICSIGFASACYDEDCQAEGSTGAEEGTGTGTGTGGTETGDTGGEASLLPPLPAAMNAFAAAVAGNDLFVSGGHVGKAHENSIEFLLSEQYWLDLSLIQSGQPQATWQPMLPLPEPTQQLTLFSHAGHLHRLGGLVSRSTAEDTEKALFTLPDFWRFDSLTQQWTGLAPMPSSRASHSATTVGNTLVVAGGWHLSGPAASGQYHDTWLTLDMANPNAAWEVHEQPFRLRDHCAGVMGTKVYLIGGMHSGQFPKQPQVYDLAAPELGWQLGPELPTTTPLNGFGCAAASTAEGMYFSAAEGKVFALNPDGLGWTEIATLQESRIFHQLVATAENQLIALGGGVGQDVLPIASVEVIQLPE